jgi:uncharacterized membrane protein YhaH (DUF805 family)
MFQYLFSFEGRINRAALWRFVPVTLVWASVIALIAVVGLRSPYLRFLHMWETLPSYARVLVFHWPPAIGLWGWIAIGIITTLVFLYFVSLFAVCTKRLHDRNKSVWWLIPFLIVPSSVALLDYWPAPDLLALGDEFGPSGIVSAIADLIGTSFIFWAFLELTWMRGTRGINRFGPDPFVK